METITSLFVFLFFLVLPCIAIFSFTSTLTRGVYNWAERQNDMDIKFTSDFPSPRRKLTPEEENDMYMEYFGHSQEIEDSTELQDRLDEIEFDFRNYMRNEDAKRAR
jgi:hypothetical protein